MKLSYKYKKIKNYNNNIEFKGIEKQITQVINSIYIIFYCIIQISRVKIYVLFDFVNIKVKNINFSLK